MRGKIGVVARKELESYFSSPVAFIFLGIFLVVSMFVFFWVNMFFARNIADLRPLFNWMPVLLIFLVAALTMRMWSEERRAGSIEFLMTAPIKTADLVLGKFLACLGLVAIALLLTLGTPITVSLMGDLDWGPVLGAYLGALLLAASYIAIGLYISARSDNQIVSLMLTLVVCLLFYLIGSETLGSLLGNRWAEVLGLIGTGSRFESINRGVIDIRDLYYYLSLVGAFLALNVFTIERLRWSAQEQNERHAQIKAAVALVVANFIFANLWLEKVPFARVDLTEGRSFTISDSTRAILERLQEPLLIRGYFSAKTHPKLAPLVPQIRDVLKEYEVAGDGRVRAEFVDPREDPKIEEEANRKYSIKPVPFQVADKYEAGLVNSYFDILVEYGDKYEALSFRDLIDVKPGREGDLEVELRNLEYDITRAIKKTLYGFQTTDSLFAAMKKPVQFVGYFSAKDKLPEKLGTFEGELQGVLAEIKKNSGGKFDFSFQNPQAEGGKLAQEIGEKYGFRPMVIGLLDPNQFYFYMVLQSGDKIVEVPLPENITKEGAQKSIEGALKRFSPGFLKTVGISTPRAPMQNPYMPQMNQGKQFRIVQEKLGEGHTVKSVDLAKGTLPEDVDLLLLLSPENFTRKQLFAVDQFLMKGGTVVLSTAPFAIEQGMGGGNINSSKTTSGLEDWLKYHGVSLEEKLVLDPDSDSYPVPRRRKAGPFTVEEVELVPYLPFVDVRGDGLNTESLITARIPQVTLNWSAPIKIDAEKNKGRKVSLLLHSSDKSWAGPFNNVQPDFDAFGQYGFAADSEMKAYPLAAAVEGGFESFFKGKDSPLIEEDKKEEDKPEEAKAGEKEEDKKKEPVISGVIEKSSESARIVIFASNEFLSDQVLQISAMTGRGHYLNSLQLVENAVDWALEDPALLSIRSRGHFSRTLVPMSAAWKSFWEYLNYALVLCGLLAVYLVYRARRVKSAIHYQSLLAA